MQSSRVSLVWLFDVDGTLLLTEGAGREAISRALFEHYGIEDDLRSIPMAGRTDPLIVGDMARKHGLELAHGTPEHHEFWESTYRHMRELMTPPRGGLLPGVLNVLDAVAAGLAPEGVAVLESDREVALPGSLRALRARRYGGTVVTFAARSGAPT